MIQNNAQLNALMHSLADEVILGLDTEFVRRDTYYPILCLVQLSTTSCQYAIDILAIQDLTPLFNKLYDNKTRWIVHSSGQDLEALYLLSNKMPKPEQLFDTQIAANLLNLPAQISYQALCLELLNQEIDKTHTCYDWQKRPMPEAVLAYALADVEHLQPLFLLLDKQLSQQKKSDYLLEEAQYLIKKTQEINLDVCWHKLSGIHRLPKNLYPDAQVLTAWREVYAQSKNKPKQWIIKDKIMLEIIQKNISLADKYKAYFDAFSQDYQAKTPAILPNTLLNFDEQKIYKQLREKIEKIAKQHQICPQLIMNKKNVIAFIQGKESRLTKGWRVQILNLEF